MKTNSGSNDSMRDGQPKASGKSAEENSVTFSLTALMAQGTQTPKAPAGAAKQDDSGLIDLNALSAMEDSAGKGAGAPALDVVPAHMGLFPLDTASALTAPLSPATQSVDVDPPKKPSRSWIWVAGVGVTVAAVAAFFVGMNSGSSGNAQGAASAAATSPSSATPALLEATKANEAPQVAAVDPGAPKETAKEAPKEASKTTTIKVPVGQTKTSTLKADPGKETAKVEEKKAPAGDPCKGDLMCAMQRATKK